MLSSSLNLSETFPLTFFFHSAMGNEEFFWRRCIIWLMWASPVTILLFCIFPFLVFYRDACLCWFRIANGKHLLILWTWKENEIVIGISCLIDVRAYVISLRVMNSAWIKIDLCRKIRRIVIAIWRGCGEKARVGKKCVT